jgi:hypothetical protein
VKSLLFFIWLIACSISHPDVLGVVVGARVIHVRMVTKLAEVKQEQNASLLKVIKKEGAIGRLSEQLQSECQASFPSSPLPQAHHDFSSLFVFQRLRPSWSNPGCLGSRTQPS